jgi:hypothetical protein
MPDDGNNNPSEFERIFGRQGREGGGETKPFDPLAFAAESDKEKKKSGTDSDLLGIRTDSDRFLVKTIPERLPGDPAPPVTDKPAADPGVNPDALTIALNVNVFANLKKQSDGQAPAQGGAQDEFSKIFNKELTIGGSAMADSATIAIPLSKVRQQQGGDGKPAAPSAADEFNRLLNRNASVAPAAGPNTDNEHTRVLKMEDALKLAKPLPTTPASDAAAATIAIKDLNAAPAGPAGLPPGPSDFTRVVKGSDLRVLQEKLAAANAGQQPMPQAAAPAPAPGAAQPAGFAGSSTGPQNWQPASAPVQPYTPAAWPGGNAPSPAAPQIAPAAQQSKLSQYMPLIIVMNVLVVLAIMLVVFFALKK